MFMYLLPTSAQTKEVIFFICMAIAQTNKGKITFIMWKLANQSDHIITWQCPFYCTVTTHTTQLHNIWAQDGAFLNCKCQLWNVTSIHCY